MISAVVVVFIIGYLLIVFEHPLNINKTASALLTGILCWVLIAVMTPDSSVLELAKGKDFHHWIKSELSHHLSGISEVLFFLLGAMTIVEVIDSHNGFRKITDLIQSKNPIVLIWILTWVAFFLSALLDNLTTSIVMVALLRKLVKDKEMRMYIAALIIIAANAGGAWSPIGDVTTTMLWVGGQVSSSALIPKLIVPSILNLLVPLLVVSFMLRKNKVLEVPAKTETQSRVAGENLILFLGLGGLIMVPVFKSLTDLPPYAGVLLVLSIVWASAEWLHKSKSKEDKMAFLPSNALARIDTPSILFFLGILLAVSALETLEILSHLATQLEVWIGNQNLIVFTIGLASAVVDNVPLVAASIGMYDLSVFPLDHSLWIFLAYATGTGGSILIIGSAAGVAVMGMENINFLWYLKRISFLALLGYLSGCLYYVAFL